MTVEQTLDGTVPSPPPQIVDRGVARAWHAFVTAVQFLTRVPLPGGMHRAGVAPSLLRDSVRFTPLVGSLIGLATGTVIVLADVWWPLPVAVILGLAFEAWLTGGLHEDAVADCCDAFGGGWTRDDVLRILKDSRVGSYGVLGLTLALAFRGCTMSTLAASELLAVIVASATLGRWGILLLMTMVPPVPHREGLAKDIGEQTSLFDLACATLSTLPGIAWWGTLHPEKLALSWLAVAIAMTWWGRRVRTRLGGITGDCLGTGCYLGQLLVLLVALAETR